MIRTAHAATPWWIALAALLALAPRLDAQETRQYRYVMGTSVEVQAFGADEGRGAPRLTRRLRRSPKSIA